jgi:hypothetical protein
MYLRGAGGRVMRGVGRFIFSRKPLRFRALVIESAPLQLPHYKYLGRRKENEKNWDVLGGYHVVVREHC